MNMSMGLYLLERKGPADYEEFNGFVIRAPEPRKARRMAADSIKASTRFPSYTVEDFEITRIGTATNGDGPEILLSDYRAG